MIRSMTGFARVEQQAAWGRLVWELRAVNHRYLDLQLRLPEEFRVLENGLRQRGMKALARGKVEAALKYQFERGGAAPMTVDAGRLRELAGVLGDVAETTETSMPSALEVLSWPGVLRENPPDLEPLIAAAGTLFDAALKDFNQTREREGSKLQDFLEARITTMEVLVEQVRERAPQARDAWLQRMRDRCSDLGVEVEPARLAQEVVLASQRLDIDEELSRLAAHLVEVRAVLRRKEAVGRRLDFLMQELNREANTLSSKSQDEEMTRYAVDMKVLIEQMREQVQNIE